MWDSYTLGIRCPTDGSPCAALAKEPVNDEEQVICQKTSWKHIFITFVLVEGSFLDEVVISATRVPQKIFESPYLIILMQLSNSHLNSLENKLVLEYAIF